MLSFSPFCKGFFVESLCEHESQLSSLQYLFFGL